MTLEEAIRHAETVAEGLENTCKRDWMGVDDKRCAKEHRQLAEWLKELKQLREQTRWIPVSEKLPEETKAEYWVCTDGGYQCECRWTNNPFGLREGDIWAWSIFDIPQYSKVIAWMPLPESYKAESEDVE